MYPSFYELFKYAFGIEIEFLRLVQMFGFFLVLVFISGAWSFRREFKRQEDNGDLHGVKETRMVGKGMTPIGAISNALFGFLLGYKGAYIIQNLQEFTTQREEIVFSSSGSWIGGIVLALVFFGLYYMEKSKEKLAEPKLVEFLVMPHERIGEILSIAAIFGIFGAKLADAFDNWDSFVVDPIGTLFALSGLTFYGGLILAALALIIYGKRKKIPILRFMDVAAPGLMLGYAIGRMGCHFSGDGDWGIENTAPNPGLPDWLWSYNYPHNVANDGILIDGCQEIYCRQLVPGVWPTPIYEVVLSLIFFGILLYLAKRLKVPGILFGIYLVFNGIERFFIEGIRVNDRKEFLGVNWSLSQYIAIGLLLLGLAMIGILWANRGRFKHYTLGKGTPEVST